jgi:hypothetical protein
MPPTDKMDKIALRPNHTNSTDMSFLDDTNYTRLADVVTKFKPGKDEAAPILVSYENGVIESFIPLGLHPAYRAKQQVIVDQEIKKMTILQRLRMKHSKKKTAISS